MKCLSYLHNVENISSLMSHDKKTKKQKTKVDPALLKNNGKKKTLQCKLYSQAETFHLG